MDMIKVIDKYKLLDELQRSLKSDRQSIMNEQDESEKQKYRAYIVLEESLIDMINEGYFDVK